MSQVTIFSVQPLCPSCGRALYVGPADDPAVRTAVCMGADCAQAGKRFVFMPPTVVLLSVGEQPNAEADPKR